MSRGLMYLGRPVLLDHLLYQPDNSLIKQPNDSQKTDMLNLAGFGMAAWDRQSHSPSTPFQYRSAHVPIFERNLKSMAEKLQVSALLAHVRTVPYNSGTNIGEQNSHPFLYPGYRFALMHNGDLADFPRMRLALLSHVDPAVAQHLGGNTDSEVIYAVFLSQLGKGRSAVEAVDALERTLRIIHKVRQAHDISTCSPVNLFISDGDSIVAIRYTFDFGHYDEARPESAGPSVYSFSSLWYTTGTEYGFHEGEWQMAGGARLVDSILVASEPLTRDTSTWLEVPEYSAFYVSRGEKGVQVRYLDVGAPFF